MFLEKLKCSNCHKEIEKKDTIYIKVTANELSGYTYLKSWAKGKEVICKECLERNN